MEKAEDKAPELGNMEVGLTHHVMQQQKCPSGEDQMFQNMQGSHFLRVYPVELESA